MKREVSPSFTITNEIVALIYEIGEFIGKISTEKALEKNLILRKENRIKDGESTEFILFMLKIIQETLIELVKTQKTTDKVTDKNKERMEIIIKYLSQHDHIDNKEAQNLLGISEATAKRCLNKLVKENILEAVGEYKARKYIKREKD